jgi:hypothetical protein
MFQQFRRHSLSTQRMQAMMTGLAMKKAAKAAFSEDYPVQATA